MIQNQLAIEQCILVKVYEFSVSMMRQVDARSSSSPWVIVIFAILRFVFARYEVVIVLSIDQEMDLFVIIALRAEEQTSNAVGLFAKVVA